MGDCGIRESFFGQRLRLAQGKHGTARMGKHAMDGAFASQVFEGQSVRGTKNDQACVELSRQRQNLNKWTAMSDDRLDSGTATSACFLGEDAKLGHGS